MAKFIGNDFVKYKDKIIALESGYVTSDEAEIDYLRSMGYIEEKEKPIIPENSINDKPIDKLESLKSEADNLGIKFRSDIKEETLRKKIEYCKNSNN